MTILSELTSKKPNPAPPCLVTSSSTSRVSAREGEDALLVVHKAPGSGPIIHMSWARGSRQLVGDRYRIGENNNAVYLNLQGVTREDEGEYTVTAKNIAGESRSAVQLRVKDNSEEDDTPIFLRRLNDLSVKVGTRTRFLVEIRSSSDVKVTWHRNDLPITEEERFHFLHEGNFFCLDVAPVTVDDGGRWACVAENQAGRSSCSCRLNVLIPKAYKAPEFIEELKAILTNQGTVSLECKVVGVPTPVLKWFKDGKEIKAGDVFALTANPDDPTSLGTYTCEAVNCMGKTYSSSRVHVMGKGSREGSLKPADHPPPTGPPPHFSQELRNEKVKIGAGLTLSCQVTVPPWPKSIQWYNKEGKVEPSEKYHIMEDGLGGYSIEISPLEACDEGEWKCLAMSDAGVMGITQCTVFMTYPKNYRKPKFLESLKAILTEEGLVSFECKVVGFPTPQLQWFKDGQELRPGDVYQLTGTNSLGSYSCIAKNCMGEARSTAELTVEDIQGQLNDEEKLLLFSKNQPPRFIRGLKSCEAKINEDFRFTVQVTIVPEPSLTWYKDDAKVEKTDRLSIVRDNLGTCHLDIKKLEMTDQAEWKCVATNDFGQSVTSGFLKLTIPKHYKKPRFLECLRAILTEEGAVNLECKVIGVPQPSLKWYKDGKELKPGDIHKIISGQDGTCCLGIYTCEAHNCMGTVSSSASLLGFEDRMAIKESAIYKPDLPYNLAKNTSLSTINEERTSQLYDTPMSERSVTMDERGDVSFSFDGKEVSISLYETPDLTEEEALQVVEMYAEELSEHVSEQNVVELPPLRFTKESSKSGPLLMEAVVIDVTPEYFSSAEEDLRTEADFEDVSMSEETSHGVQSPPTATDEALYEKINADFLEKALAGLAGTKKPSQEKSSGSDKDSFKSLSDHKKDDVAVSDAYSSGKAELDRRESKKGSKKSEPKTKKARSRSVSSDGNQSFDENVEEGVVTVVPKRKSVSRSSSGGSSDKPARKKSKSRSDSADLDTIIGDAPKKTETEESKQTKRKASRTSSESADETLLEARAVRKKKRSKSKSVEKENVAPKAPARKKKASVSGSENKMEEETSGHGAISLNPEEKKEVEPESEKLIQSSSTSGIRNKRSSGSPSVDTEEKLKTDMNAKKRKSGRSRSSSADKSQKTKEERREIVEPTIESKEVSVTESKPKGSMVLLKNLTVTLQDIRTGLTNVADQIKTKCAAESLPPTADYKLLSKPIGEIQKNLMSLEQTLNEETAEVPTVGTLQSIDRLLEDLKTGLKLIDEKETAKITETLEIFSLILNHLQNQIGDWRTSGESETQKAVEMLLPLSTPIDHLNGAINQVKAVLAQRPKPDKSQVSVELLQILAQPVQDLKQAMERVEAEEAMGVTSKPSTLAEPIKNLQTAISLLEQYAAKEHPEDSVSRKILKRLSIPLERILKGLQQGQSQQGRQQLGENLSDPIQTLHKELAKMVQETLFPPQKSQSPYAESLPVLQKISQSTTSILNKLSETENVPAAAQQKIQIFSPIVEPLATFKKTIEKIERSRGEEIPAEVFNSQLEKLDNQLAGVERNLETASQEVKNEINQENLIQNVKEIRKEILTIFQAAPNESTWNALLGSLQKLSLNLSWEKPGEKPRQLLTKSSSSLGKSLELIKQTSEEQFIGEAQTEEPRMSLTVLRPLEKPLQDLEEGFGVMVKHILEKERLTDEEKPAVEGQLHDLLEILSQSFESFQEKWVEIDGSSKSGATLQEANTLLELVKELHDGANAIQFQMVEFETISNKASEVIKKNIYSNLKNLTGSIAQVEKAIRKESLEAVPNLKTLKTTAEKLHRQISMAIKQHTPEETQILEQISTAISKLTENLEEAKYKPATEENPIWDQVVQKTLHDFQQQLTEVEAGARSKLDLKKHAAVEEVLQGAAELARNLQTQKQLKVETLPRVTSSLEEFKERVKWSTRKEAKPKRVEEVLQVVETNMEVVQKVLHGELKDRITRPLEILHRQLQQMSGADVGIVQNLLQPLINLQQGFEVAEKINRETPTVAQTLSGLAVPAEEIQQVINTFEIQAAANTQDSEVINVLLEPLQQLSFGLTQVIPTQQTDALQQVVYLIKTNLILVSEKEMEGKQAIVQPLRQLQEKLEDLPDRDETTTQIVIRLMKPLKNLEKGLLAYDILPLETTKEFTAVQPETATLLIEAQKELAAVQQQIAKSTQAKDLEKLLEPLNKLQMGISEKIQQSPKEEKLTELINIVERDIASIAKLEILQAETKLNEPLKAIKAKLVEVDAEGKADEASINTLQDIVEPLKHLQEGLQKVEELKTESLKEIPTNTALAVLVNPLVEVQQQIVTIEKQAVLQQGEKGKQTVLQELLQPLQNLQQAVLQILQPLQTPQEITKTILPTAQNLTQVIHAVEKNVEALQSKHVITEETTQALIKPLEAIQAKIVQVTQMEQPNVQTAEVIQCLAKPLQELQTNLEQVEQLAQSSQGPQLVQAMTAIVAPLVQVQNELSVIETQAVESGKTGGTEVLQEIAEPLHSLQTGIALVIQPMETTEELKPKQSPREKLSEVIHLVEYNVATLESQQVLKAETKQALAEPLKILEAKLTEVGKMEKADEKTVTVLESLAQPLQALQEGLESMQPINLEETDELKTASSLSALAVPLVEMQKAIATVQEQTVLELSKPTATTEEKKILEEFIEPLQKLQTGLAEVLTEGETTRELILQETQKEKLSEVIHLVEGNVAVINKIDSMQPEAKLAIIDSLKTIQAELVYVSKEEKATENTITVLECIAEPLKKLKKGLEAVERIHGETVTEQPAGSFAIAVASPLVEAQKFFATVQQHTLCEMERQIKTEDREILERFIQPLEELQAKLLEVSQPSETTEELKGLLPEASKLSEVLHAVEMNVARLEKKDVLESKEQHKLMESLKALKDTLTEVETQKVDVSVFENLVEPLRKLQKGLEIAENILEEPTDELKKLEATKALATPFIEAQKGLAMIEEQTVLELNKPSGKTDEQKEALTKVLEPLHEVEVCLTKVIKPKTIEKMTRLVAANVALIKQKEPLQASMKTVAEPLKTLEDKLQMVRYEELSKQAETLMTESLIKPLKNLQRCLKLLKEEKIETIEELDASPTLTALTVPLVDMQKGIVSIENATKQEKSCDRVLEVLLPSLQDLKAGLDKILKYEEGAAMLQELDDKFVATQGILNLIDQKALTTEPELFSAVQNLEKELIKTSGERNLKVIIDSIETVKQQIEAETVNLPLRQKNLLLRLKVELDGIEQNLTTEASFTLKRRKKDDSTLEKLTEAVRILHEGFENTSNAFEEGQLQSLSIPIAELENALENLVVDEKSKSAVSKAVASLQDFSQALGKVEEQIEKQPEMQSTVETLAQPIAEIRENVAQVQESSFLKEGVESLSESETSLLKTLAEELHELLFSVLVHQQQPPSEVSDLTQKSVAKEEAAVKQDEQGTVLTTKADVREDVEELSDKTEISLLKAVGQSSKELNKALATVKQEVVLEGEKSLKELSTVLLEKLAQPAQELAKAVAVVEHQTVLDVKGGSISTITSPSQLETLAKPIQALHRNLAEIHQQVALLKEVAEEPKKAEMVKAVVAPIEDLFRCVGALQEQAGLDSDVTTISEKLDPSHLKTLAHPAQEIKEILAVVEQFKTLEQEVEMLPSQSQLTEEVAKPLRDINQALAVFEQLAMEFVKSPEKDLVLATEAIAKPVQELQTQMAVAQSHHFEEDETGKIKTTPEFEMLQKIATPLQELFASVTVLEQQLLEGTAKTLSEDQTLMADFKISETPETVSEMGKAMAEEVTVLTADDTSVSEATETEEKVKVQKQEKIREDENKIQKEQEKDRLQKEAEEKRKKLEDTERLEEQEERTQKKESNRLKQDAEEKKKKEEVGEELKKEEEKKKEEERLKKDEKKKKEEEERLKKQAEEKKKEEEERLKKGAEEKKKKGEEEARLKKEEEEARLKKEEEEARLKKEAEEKKKEEEEARLKKEAEEKKKEEEEAQLKKKAEEKKKKEEEEARLKKEAEEKKKKEEEEARLKKEAEEKKKKEEEEARLKKEAEEKKKKEEEEARLKKEAEEKKKKEEEEARLKKEAEEKKKKEEEEARLKKEAEEKKKKEEEEARQKKEAEEKKKKEEEEARLKKEAEEKKKKEEEEARLKKEAEEKKEEEEARLKKEAEEKKKKEEEEARLKKEAEEKKKKEEEEARLKKEAEEKKKKEEEEARLKKEAEEKKKKKEEEARLKKEAEEKKKKEEEEARLKKEAEEKKKKEEEEARLKKEAEEKKKKEEEEARLKKEAEEKKKKEEEEARLKKEAEEKKKKEEEEARLKKEAEEKNKKKEEEARLKKEAEEKKKKEEEEARLKKEAEKKKKEEEEARLKKETEEKKKKEEEEAQLKKEAEEKKKKEEEEARLKKEAEEKKKKEEEEARLKKEAEEKKKKEEEEARLKKEAEKKKKEEEEARLKKETEEKKKKEEEEAQLKKEAEEKKKEEEEARLKKEAEEKKKEEDEERLKKEAKEKNNIEKEEQQRKELEEKKKKESMKKKKKQTEKEKEEEKHKLLKEVKKQERVESDENKEEEEEKSMVAEKEKKKDVNEELKKGKERGEKQLKRETEELDEKANVQIEENVVNDKVIVEEMRQKKEIGKLEEAYERKKSEGAREFKTESKRKKEYQKYFDETRKQSKTGFDADSRLSPRPWTGEGATGGRAKSQERWQKIKTEVAEHHLENVRDGERTIKDKVPEIRERRRDTFRSSESLGGLYRSNESLRDVYRPNQSLAYRSNESLRNIYRSNESIRDLYRSSESLRDAYRSTESFGHSYRPKDRVRDYYRSTDNLKGTYRPPESWRDHRQSYEDLYEVRKHREPLGSYPLMWEDRSSTMDVKEADRRKKKKPTFCTRLLDRTAAEGSTVKLTCTVLSHPEPSVQWLKDGSPIFIKSSDYTSGRYRSKLQDGFASLEITNVVSSDSGEYTCLAQNPLGQVSTTSTLKVYGGYEPAPFPPTFTRPISESYKFSEDELILECRVRSQPMPRVVWTKNGNPIRASSRYQITERTDGLCTLTIYHPEADDSGEYTCKAENAVASSSSTHHLTFSGRQQYLDSRLTDRRSEGRLLREYQKPQFHMGLTDSHVHIGGTIALQVELRGTPREVKWLRGTEELPRMSSKIRTFEDSGVYTLLVSDASEKEAGTYTCRAYSGFGHVETSAAVQVVPVSAIRDGKPPKIINRPNTMMTVTVEDDVAFTCRVTGQPKPKVTWLKGVKDITISERTMVEHSDDYYKFALKRAVPADAGTYWIIAKNLHGSDRAFITLQIKQRAKSLTPDPFSSSRWNWGSATTESMQEIRDVKKQKEKYQVKETPGPISKEPFVVDSGRNWVTLSWSKPINRGAAPVVAYRVDIWQVGDDGGARWSELGVSPGNSFDVFNLKQGVDYKFRITPRNCYGWGEPLVTSTPVTLGNKVINIPEFVKILPGQLKALLGHEIKLECQVVSDVIPSITWFRDSLPIDFENSERFSSKFDGRNCLLRIENLKEEDSGRYMCEAVNRMGRVSTFARLMVVSDPKIWEADTHLKREMLEEGTSEVFPPQFTMRLRDRRVQMTYPVRLTCQVLGSPNPRLTWYRDGNELVQDDRHAFTCEDHFYTLEISKTILEDSGCYTATAKNDCGSVSCHCNLVVDKGIRAYVAPEFVTELTDIRSVKYGEELRLSAQVEAYPSVGVVWYRNGVRLRPSRRIIMTLDHDGTIELSIAGITERESGAYTCTAANEVGRCETTCKVTVTPETSSSSSVPQIQEPQLPYSKAPIFIRKPRSSEAVEGDTVIIDCEVVGDPKPEVIWLRDFLKPDYYRDSPNFQRQGEGPSYRLQIPHAKLDFTGTYSVVARNVHGEAKAVISLQIYAKGQGKEDRMDHSPVTHGNVETLPVFQKGLKDLRCCDGDAVTLECVVSAATTPEIRWEKGGRLLPLGNDFVANFDGKTATLTIKQVYPEDEGEYTCVAISEIGRTSTSACLVVDVPEEKENLLSRQLTRPTGLMSGASTPRSTPRTTPSRSISPYPSGYGWRESSTSSLRQKRLKVAPPKFYAVPHNRIAEEGETVRFQCAVAGHPTPWVTWDKDNIVVTPSARLSITEKEDLKILEIEEVTFEDAGLYRVTLENEVGRVEATARLDVMGPRGFKAKYQNVRSWSASPTFRRRLLGSAGRLGGNVTLACDIKANPNPVTSWYRNGELVVRTNRIRPTWDGQTAMLEIEDLEMDDFGVYTCVAENEFGKCHCSAELSVLEGDDTEVMPPVFVEPLTDTTVEEGTPAELQVRIKGSAPLDVVWVKNNREIPNCEDFRYVDYDDGRFGLRIADVFSEDSGEYLCEVFNQYGEAVSSAKLLVKEPVTTLLPKIGFSKRPTSVIVASGRSASFCCRLQHESADPPRSLVQWKVGDRIIGPDVFPKYTVEENSDVNILLINSVDRKDSGQITCTARYTCSKCSLEPYSTEKCDCGQTALSCSAELTVLPRDSWVSDGECDGNSLKRPRSRSLSTSEIQSDQAKMLKNSVKYSELGKLRALILRGPNDVNVFRGERVVLRATYSGQPEPKVRWLKGGRVLENNDRLTIITGEGATSLSFDCNSADDSGKYVVSVENEFGTDCHFASVAVEGPPDSPASYPIVTSIGNNAVEVEWSSPAFDGGSKITGYVVEMKNSSQNEWTRVSGPCHSFSYTARNLQPNTKYRFRVRAENVHGQSEPSYESNEVAVIPDSADFSSETEPRIVTVESSEAFKAKYEVLEELGKGRYGIVHKVADLETGQKMAAKFIRCIKVKDKEKVKEEIDIMNSLRHPKLLRLAAAFESPREMVMVMEYISGGELFERVVADDFQLTERDCILFMRQICEGVEYMHKNSVVHLDLKPENIMCQSRTSHEIKLIDFGLARKLDPDNPVRVLFGTPEFVPPEIINYEPIGFESDMWSVGVICYVLLSGLSPFMGENDAETFANITRSSYDFDEEAFNAISQDAKDFISSLLVKRKEKRLTASECLKNKWMMSEDDKTMGVILSTDKLKKFIIRRKWQKTGNAIRALGRMASLSAASRKNSQPAKFSANPPFPEETAKTVDACGIINSSPNRFMSDKITTIGTIEEEVKEVVLKEEPNNAKTCNERSDSGISDCSSVGSGSHSVTCQCSGTLLLNKKYSITEEDETLKPCKTDHDPLQEPKLPKEVIGTKVDNIRKKFANLSKNIDEMDKKLENVGKKLVDIGPGKITAAKKPEIKRVPSLKDHKNPDAKKSHLMQHTASSQAKITIALKQPTTPAKETSTVTIPVSPELRTAKLSRTRVSVKANQSSFSSPTAKNRLPESVKPAGSYDHGGRGIRTQPSAKIQRLQQVYNTKATAPAVVPKEVGTKPGMQKKGKDLTDPPKVIHGRQANFQETIAFWKR